MGRLRGKAASPWKSKGAFRRLDLQTKAHAKQSGAGPLCGGGVSYV